MTAPSQSIPLDKFLASLDASGLLSVGYDEALAAFRAGDSFHERIENVAQAFGDYLVREKLLTRWQCDRLLEGRHIGFFVDQYTLLSFVRVEDTHTVYLAEDPATGHRVFVLSTPPICSPDGQGHVRIVEIE